MSSEESQQGKEAEGATDLLAANRAEIQPQDQASEPNPEPSAESKPSVDKVADSAAGSGAAKATTAVEIEPAKASDASWRPSMTFLIVVSLVNFVADVASKQWTKHYFDNLKSLTDRRIVVIDGFMNLIYARNRGGAWGFLQAEADALRRPFFLVVSVAAIVFIVSLYRKLNRDQLVLRWGLPLVLGGALGNLADRIYYGFVIDFIDVYITRGGQESHWPTFNVADISICVGVVLMAIDMFTSQEPKKASEPAVDTGGQGPGATALAGASGAASTPAGGAALSADSEVTDSAVLPETAPALENPSAAPKTSGDEASVKLS